MSAPSIYLTFQYRGANLFFLNSDVPEVSFGDTVTLKQTVWWVRKKKRVFNAQAALYTSPGGEKEVLLYQGMASCCVEPLTIQLGAVVRLKKGGLTIVVDPDPKNQMALVTPSGASSSVVKRQTFDLDDGDIFEINGFRIKFDLSETSNIRFVRFERS